jgi:hypothetical protein
MLVGVPTTEPSDYNNFTRQYNPEDSSEHHTFRREILKSHNICSTLASYFILMTFFVPLYSASLVVLPSP